MANPPKRMSPAQLEQAVAKFNAANPVGTDIHVYPGAKSGDPRAVQVVSPGAYVLGGHTAVVQVSGEVHGCIALTHVAKRVSA